MFIIESIFFDETYKLEILFISLTKSIFCNIVWGDLAKSLKASSIFFIALTCVPILSVNFSKKIKSSFFNLPCSLDLINSADN